MMMRKMPSERICHVGTDVQFFSVAHGLRRLVPSSSSLSLVTSGAVAVVVP
jgi:hypothetical protein